MERSHPVLPVPELLESNLNLSFKFANRDDHRRNKRPPKLYPKEINFFRNGNREPHAVSFRESSSISNTSTPKSKNTSLDLSSSFYDRNKSESYFEQCFETIRKLGEGSFGEVFQVRCKQDGKHYAVKKMRYFHRGGNYRRERMEEVRRYEEFSGNENCVTLFKAWEQSDVLFMQIELCRGSVEDYVEEVKQVSESFVWSFLLDMLLALKSLHDRNLIHLDIKLDNVLITDDNHCKLADFGLIFDLKNSNRSRLIEGDSRYLAPELLEGNYCLANDIFSLGITLLELATNLELPANGQLWQDLRSGASHLPADVINKLSPELKEIVIAMMNPDARLRPTADQLLQHKTLKKLMIERKVKRALKTVKSSVASLFGTLWSYITLAILFVFNFFQLRGSASKATQYRSDIYVHHIDENSDVEPDFKSSSVNSSRVEKMSTADDDNNNESNVTPTLNNSIPRVTPEIKIINSTPLNHYNHQYDGMSSRKYRRDLTKSCFEAEDGFCSPVISRNNSSLRNSSQDRDSLVCSKKLLFRDEDLDEL